MVPYYVTCVQIAVTLIPPMHMKLSNCFAHCVRFNSKLQIIKNTIHKTNGRVRLHVWGFELRLGTVERLVAARVGCAGHSLHSFFRTLRGARLLKNET